MPLNDDRSQLRRFYFEVWQKRLENKALEPMERLIAEVIEQHPEYHALFAHQDAVIDRDYLPETGESNPFLHMGMHIGLREQLAADRPAGIGVIHQRLLIKTGAPHDAEHRMIECLAETLWQAQRNGTQPDEKYYIDDALQQLTGST